MGLGWLPLEKMPIFIWGLLLIIIGGFLLFHEKLLSWEQGKAFLIVIAGVGACIYDLRKRSSTKLEGQEKVEQKKSEINNHF